MIKNKYPVKTTIIMEGDATEPAKISNLKVVNEPGNFFVEFAARLQSFNVFNRNIRKYVGKVMVPAYNAPHIIELEQKKSWCGEAGHPMSDDVKRILTIDPKGVSHKVLSHTVNENFCDGIIQTLNDGTGFGTKMARMILQGMEVAFSLRALANMVTKNNGESVIDTKPHIVCLDWVFLPSHTDAYMKTETYTATTEAATNIGNAMMSNTRMVPVTESALLDFIAMESGNINIVSNINEIVLEGMSLSTNGKYAILKEQNAKYVVPLEEQIQHIIGEYMRKL